ncbi:MAG: hypothetical protein ABIK75_06985 [candidate division WOR-3 bacterium]
MLEAAVGIALFIIIISFTTSRVQDVFLANAQEALYESLKQRGYAISSFIKLWLETRFDSIDEIKNMDEESFKKVFIYRDIPVAYYVKISPIVEVVKRKMSGEIIESMENVNAIEKGNKEISSHAIRIVDMARIKNVLWLIEVYLWVE